MSSVEKKDSDFYALSLVCVRRKMTKYLVWSAKVKLIVPKSLPEKSLWLGHIHTSLLTQRMRILT